MTLEKVIAGIRPCDRKAALAAERHWDTLAKPLGSLGVLENDIVKIASVQGTADVRLEKRVLYVICSDNEVIRHGVSQSDETVTTAVASALGNGTSTVNYMAAKAGCMVKTVDAGMKEDTPTGVRNCKIRRAAGDLYEGSAMTKAECEKAILLGVSLADEEKERGTDILLLGEMGIGNTTSSAAVASVLLGMDPETAAGRGAGLSQKGLEKKMRVIRHAIEVSRPDLSDPFDVLMKVGGLDIAVLCGLCLGGALYRIPVILDGLITNTAALCAVRMCPDTADALIASHVSSEPAAMCLLKEMGLEPCICAGLHLGEGSGAVLALGLLDQALAVYASSHTFGELGIKAYRRL